jgi:hypothetical protein
MMISARRVREDRKFRGWPLVTLASESQIGATSIGNFQNGKASAPPFKVLAIRRPLRIDGVEFDDKRRGVRMRVGKQ